MQLLKTLKQFEPTIPDLSGNCQLKFMNFVGPVDNLLPSAPAPEKLPSFVNFFVNKASRNFSKHDIHRPDYLNLNTFL